MQKLDETNDPEKINFYQINREFQLLNEIDKKVVISLLISIFIVTFFCSILFKRSSTFTVFLKLAI